jgi:hypothetical protein
VATTRAAWRALVRAELGDEAATKLWSDALLNAWLNEAIRDYGRAVPREATATLTTVASQTAYTLPSDLVQVVRVEHPTNTFRVFARRVGGDWVDPTPDPSPTGRGESGRYGYDVWGGQLLLEPAPTASGESIGVRYVARRTEPTSDGDALPVEDGDVELLTLYVCGRALDWITSQEAKRQAFERDRGASASATAAGYAGRYAAELAARRRQGRPGRRLVLRDL